jgi:hypothetical protein
LPPETTPSRPVDGNSAIRIAPAPDPAPKERKRKPETELRWTAVRRAELIDLWNRRPLLSVDEIGALVGRTGSSIQTAASRFGLPRRQMTGAGNVLETLSVPAAGGMKPCMACGENFWSKGKFNRLCIRCKAPDSDAADVA